MARPPDAPIGREADYQPTRDDPRHITDVEAAVLALDGPAVQAEMAAELAGEEELPLRGPAEAPGNRPAQAARPDVAASRERGDNAADNGEAPQPDHAPT